MDKELARFRTKLEIYGGFENARIVEIARKMELEYEALINDGKRKVLLTDISTR